MFYPAYIHADADGSASGFFPDVPGCYFAGDTLNDAFRDAQSGLMAILRRSVKGGRRYPARVGWNIILRRSLTISPTGSGCWWTST